MQILIKGNRVIEAAHNIVWGTFDEPIEKWALLDEQGNIFLYVIDDGYTLIDSVEVPDDYTYDKYFFEDGQFVLNPNWQPPLPPAEVRIAQLEEMVAIHEDNDAELLFQISLLQLGIDEDLLEEEV